ncbi:3-isopropylmalate dehydratase small subunit [Acetomicrobium sp. UBA5826]|uniref:3-isopropylmalate dehydratase small subunit n=1 Tax=Acetomicrobium sp. UBA5826 TaxID=1946039 RepID=UPI00258038A9|nr:3-isopropylmalate dehydratase small subunit [Acetomicrobium sp. UBA5826]
MIIRGKALKYGDHVDTDVIIPGVYLSITDPRELAKHCMEGVDPDFPKKVKKGDILVAGINFGCGSSREHAPMALKECGVGAVVAKSFAAIFYRNAINIGLPLVECADAVDEIDENDEIEIDMELGELKNITKGKRYKITPLPESIKNILGLGGLIEYVKNAKGSV